MKRYNIIDEQGFVFSKSKGIFTDEFGNKRRSICYWGNPDWGNKKLNMILISALLQKWLMKMEGLRVTIKPVKEIK